jgi:uncharacterized protein (TIGR00251 family)
MTAPVRKAPVAPHVQGSALAISVVPRSSRNGLELAEDGSLRLRVTAPPVDGAANAAVLRFLADALDVPRSRISLVSGEKSRRKRLVVAGMTVEDLERRIQNVIGYSH